MKITCEVCGYSSNEEGEFDVINNKTLCGGCIGAL